MCKIKYQTSFLPQKTPHGSELTPIFSLLGIETHTYEPSVPESETGNC